MEKDSEKESLSLEEMNDGSRSDETDGFSRL